MKEKLDALVRRVDELQARMLADQCLLEYGLFALPVSNLRGMLLGVESLGESVFVKLMNRPSSEPGLQAFEARREYWLSRLQTEIASRETPPSA